MFQSGQLVVYGGEGVCKIVDVGVPALSGMQTTRAYYTLYSEDRHVTVYVPVDHPGSMRAVMTAEEADALIRRMPEIDLLPAVHAGSFLQRDAYDTALHSQDRTDLVRILKTIYSRQHPAGARARQPRRIDEEYRKRAENILYSEFSAALHIPRDQIPAYIERTISSAEPEQ